MHIGANRYNRCGDVRGDVYTQKNIVLLITRYYKEGTSISVDVTPSTLHYGRTTKVAHLSSRINPLREQNFNFSFLKINLAVTA